MNLIKKYLQGVAQRNLRTRENDLLGPAGFTILQSQENGVDGTRTSTTNDFNHGKHC